MKMWEQKKIKVLIKATQSCYYLPILGVIVAVFIELARIYSQAHELASPGYESFVHLIN
jgi:hypothetical protein